MDSNFYQILYCIFEWPFDNSGASLITQLVKISCNARDAGSIPGLVNSPGEGIGYTLQYSWASLVAQMVNNPPVMQDIPEFNPWAGNIAWNREQLPNPVFWPSPQTEEQATVHGLTKSLTQLHDFHSFMIIFLSFNIMFRSIVLTSFKLLNQSCNPRKCSTLGFIYLSPMYSWVYFTNFSLFVCFIECILWWFIRRYFHFEMPLSGLKTELW